DPTSVAAKQKSRARRIAITVCILTLATVPLVDALNRTARSFLGERGILDASGAWRWEALTLAGIVVGAASYFLYMRRVGRQAPSDGSDASAAALAPGHDADGFGQLTTNDANTLSRDPSLVFQDAMLQAMVTAKMAIEVEQPSTASDVLERAIASAGEVLARVAQAPSRVPSLAHPATLRGGPNGRRPAG
ncbi:hypothetical protein, partial [Nocardioides sp.]|uniref:hypothetical protein n=1 Tax=Nocardioides sp. TaxID=35761 RepID=UPI003563E5BD